MRRASDKSSNKVIPILVISALAISVAWNGYQQYNVLTEKAKLIIAEKAEQALKAKMLLERDPLEITALPIDYQTIGCGGTVFLPRHVKVTKELEVHVERKIKYLGQINGVTYTLPNVAYTERNVIDADITYRFVTPTSLPNGLYEYAPILTYKVNKYLTITKNAPPQEFEVFKTKCGGSNDAS